MVCLTCLCQRRHSYTIRGRLKLGGCRSGGRGEFIYARHDGNRQRCHRYRLEFHTGDNVNGQHVVLHLHSEQFVVGQRHQRWLAKSEQRDKWNFCLNSAMLPQNTSEDDGTYPP